MKLPPPRVSVLIDTYNHERFIEKAIVSVLEQDFPAEDMEILVVDDGSTDRTPEIVRKFEPRVRLIRKENGGQASAFNVGIAEARSEIIAFLDGDDWWRASKLRSVMQVFDEDPGIAAVGHGFYEVYGEGPPLEMFGPADTCLLDLSSVEAARIADLGRTLLGTSRLSVRKRVLDKIAPIPLELNYCADTPILTLALALGGAIVLNQPLCYYRHHAENLFAQDSEDVVARRRKFKMLDFLLGFLPARLSALGVPDDVIDALFESDRTELNRMRLQLEGGTRWTTFQTERRAFHSVHNDASIGYKFFKLVAHGMALLLPPRYFYGVRSWYTRMNLKRLRGVMGEATPIVPADYFRHRPVLLAPTDDRK